MYDVGMMYLCRSGEPCVLSTGNFPPGRIPYLYCNIKHVVQSCVRRIYDWEGLPIRHVATRQGYQPLGGRIIASGIATTYLSIDHL